MMEAGTLFNAFLALIFVLGLIGLTNFALRRFGPDRLFYAHGKKKNEKRLKVEETLVLDARRRIVLVRCDKQEHLVLLGATTEQVIAKIPAGKKPHA